LLKENELEAFLIDLTVRRNHKLKRESNRKRDVCEGILE